MQLLPVFPLCQWLTMTTVRYPARPWSSQQTWQHRYRAADMLTQLQSSRHGNTGTKLQTWQHRYKAADMATQVQSCRHGSTSAKLQTWQHKCKAADMAAQVQSCRHNHDFKWYQAKRSVWSKHVIGRYASYRYR
jgi:hypothetical protein